MYLFWRRWRRHPPQSVPDSSPAPSISSSASVRHVPEILHLPPNPLCLHPFVPAQDVKILRTIVVKILQILESVRVVVMSKTIRPLRSLYLILSSRPRSNLRSPMCPSRLPCLHGGGALAVIINSNYNYITHKRMREKQHQKVCTIKILVVLKLVR